MTTANKYVPLLRFSNFFDDWENNRLEDVALINPKSENLPKSFIYLDLESVVNGSIVKEDFIELKDAPSRAQRLLENNDIIYQTVRPYQKNNLLFKRGENYVASTGYAQLRTLCRPDYLYQYLHTDSFVNKVMFRCTGTSYPAINSSDLATIEIYLPTLPEQQKIATFLSAIDANIGILTKKKILLEHYKQGVMQQLFNQQIRFKDEKGGMYPDWEVKKIEDIFEVTRGTVLSMLKVRAEKTEDYKYPVFSSQTKNSGLAGYYTEYLFDDAITWTTDGANAGNVNYRKEKFFCTNVCGVLNSKEGYANKFIAELLNSVTHKYVSYVGNPKLMNNVMAKIELSIPISIQEQQKISSFLNSIDKKIDTIRFQMESVKKFKKGLLQLLFV